MTLAEVYERFVEQSPAPVIARAVMENCLGAPLIDRVFNENAEHQREGELLFSTVVDVLQLTVLRGRRSLNSAYKSKQDEIAVSIRSLYQKLAGVEPNVCRALLCDTSQRMTQVIDELGKREETLPGYHVKIADGKHLDRTERRLKPLRELNAAPLPGQVIAVLDADVRQVADIIPCEDGHAQERSLLEELQKSVEQRDVWIADRNFCTTDFLGEIDSRKAYFVIRRHGNLRARSDDAWKRVGRCKTGVIRELQAVIGEESNPLQVRHIVVELDKPTREGDKELEILTNLPKDISAQKVAELYRDRWTVEQAFQAIAESLQAEIKTFAYPKAALLGYVLGLIAFNMLGLVKASVATANDRSFEQLSTYYLSEEISAIYGGMMIVLDPHFWRTRFRDLTPAQLACELRQIAQHVPDNRFQKNKSRPRRAPKKQPKTNRNHVSTKRVLEKASR